MNCCLKCQQKWELRCLLRSWLEAKQFFCEALRLTAWNFTGVQLLASSETDPLAACSHQILRQTCQQRADEQDGLPLAAATDLSLLWGTCKMHTPAAALTSCQTSGLRKLHLNCRALCLLQRRWACLAYSYKSLDHFEPNMPGNRLTLSSKCEQEGLIRAAQ